MEIRKAELHDIPALEKNKILTHYERSMLWVESLMDISETYWRKPVGRGKWTVAEVIGHLIPWDEFIFNQRLPFLFGEDELPKSPNVEEVNSRAANDSRGCSKEETIKKFLSNRYNLISAIQNLDDELWQQNFKIGDSELTLYSYFSGLVDHDEHHFLQIKHLLK